MQTHFRDHLKGDRKIKNEQFFKFRERMGNFITYGEGDIIGRSRGGGVFFIGAKRHTKNKMIESARVILGKPIIICVH